MWMVLVVEIDPTGLVEPLAALTASANMLAMHANQDALARRLVTGLPDMAAVRALLTAAGLTPRQSDLVLLDVQGYTRADIAAYCGISPATVKKYWTAIYATLGIQRRQALRAWVLAQWHSPNAAAPQAHAVGAPDYPPNYPPVGDWSSDAPPAILGTRSILQVSDCEDSR